jgi:hypothetical protein
MICRTGSVAYSLDEKVFVGVESKNIHVLQGLDNPSLLCTITM